MAEQWQPLMQTARLLTGDDRLARDRVQAALAASRRRWEQLPADAPDDDRWAVALHALVRTSVSRRRTLLRGDGVLDEQQPDAWWTSPGDAQAARRLSAALDGLPAPERAAVVLRFHEAAPDPQAAEALGVPVPELHRLVDAGVRHLREEVPDPAALPDRLRGMAAQTDVGAVDGPALVRAVVAQRSTRRRRVAVAVTAVAALVAAAVVLAPEPVAPPASDAATTSDSTVISGPTRGSLAGDEDFLASLEAASYAGPPAPQLTNRRVVYAGDLLGTRWVLLAGEVAGVLRAEWLAGPSGSSADVLTGIAVEDLAGDPPLALVSTGRAGRSALLVVAAPGDQVQLSTVVDVSADGSTSRRFVPVPTVDGVAAVVLPTSSRPPLRAGAVQYRVVRDGETVHVDEPLYGPEPGAEPVTPPAALRPGRTSASLAAYDFALREGLPGDAVDPTLLWAGQVIAPGGRTANAVVVAARLPDGRVVSTTAYALLTTGESYAASCGTQLHPAGTDLTRLTVVAVCEVSDSIGRPRTSVLVTAPPDVRTVQLRTVPGGPVVYELLVLDGYANSTIGDGAFTEFSVDDGPPLPISTNGGD